MKLWRLDGTATGYDTFDSCIVAAETEDEAKGICPTYGEFSEERNKEAWVHQKSVYFDWARKPSDVIAICIGIANPEIKKGIILASFNAG